MKKLLTICAVLLIAGPALAAWNDVHVADANTILLYHLDEQTGTDTPIIDSGPSALHATFSKTLDGWNSPAYMEMDENKTWVASTVPYAGFGNAAKWWWNSASDSNTGAIAAPDPLGLGSTIWSNPGVDPGEFTIEFWMNPDGSGGGWGSRVLKKYTGGNYAVTYSASALHLGWYKAGWQGWGTTTLIAHNVWTHVAFTVENVWTGDLGTSYAELALWINGAVAETFTSPAGATFSNYDAGDVFMGNDPWGTTYTARQYTGMLDEVRISDTLRYVVPEPSMMLLALGALAIFRKK